MNQNDVTFNVNQKDVMCNARQSDVKLNLNQSDVTSEPDLSSCPASRSRILRKFVSITCQIT